MEEEFKSGKMGAGMMVTGKTTKHTVEAGSSTQIKISLKESGLKTKPMGTGSTSMWMGLAMRASGNTTSRRDMVVSGGLMAQSTRETTVGA